MIWMFCNITYDYINILSSGTFFRKLTVKIICVTFTLRALSSDLMNSGPSFIYMVLYKGKDCQYQVYCYIDEFNAHGQKWGYYIYMYNILFIN